MTYRIVPCPKCNKLHGVVAVRAERRASRPTVDLSADSALGKRERGVPGRRSSEVPERRPLAGTPSAMTVPHLPPSVPVTGTRSTQPAVATPVAIKPMPARPGDVAARSVSGAHSRASIPVEVRARREFSPARGE